jgi:hypothetical protein
MEVRFLVNTKVVVIATVRVDTITTTTEGTESISYQKNYLDTTYFDCLVV